MKKEIKHYTIRNRYALRYLCNQAVSITLNKVAKNLNEVNCKNCLLILKNPNHIHTWDKYNKKGMLCCSLCNQTWYDNIRTDFPKCPHNKNKGGKQ